MSSLGGFDHHHKFVSSGEECDNAAGTGERVHDDEDPGPDAEEVLRSGHEEVAVGVTGVENGVNFGRGFSGGDEGISRPGFAGDNDNPDKVSGSSEEDGTTTNYSQNSNLGASTEDSENASAKRHQEDDETPKEEAEETGSHVGSGGNSFVGSLEGSAFVVTFHNEAMGGFGAYSSFSGYTLALEVGVSESVDSEESDDGCGASD